jgi:hypothetical protein
MTGMKLIYIRLDQSQWERPEALAIVLRPLFEKPYEVIDEFSVE